MKMGVTQMYTKCLAQGAYLIESQGEAAIIDPLRETQPYLDLIQQKNLKLKYIFETHFHADFVSGHLTLSQKAKAPIVYGPQANPAFDVIIAKDGDIFQIGDLSIKVLHTPGHTLESSTYLLLDENHKEKAIFTGDTLFLGDVGRPDLAQKAANTTQEDLAAMLFDSLREKIMPLPNDLMVYPGHGAGSACGKNMMDETQDTLGNQKKVNYALNVTLTKDEFVKELTQGLLPPPAYFPLNVALNKNGYQDVDLVLQNAQKPLEADEFYAQSKMENAVVLDVRTKDEFVQSHIPNAVFIGLDGTFAPWVGSLLVDTNTPILLVVNEPQLEETVLRLARVGFDNVLGYLKGGMNAWTAHSMELQKIPSVEPNELSEGLNMIDVRGIGEYKLGHVKGATNIALAELPNKFSHMDRSKQIYLHCATGYRSVIAASLLQRNGFKKVINVLGGYEGIFENAPHLLSKAN
ncbi:MAG: Hydroxyacylglutathione hydrolase GloC [Bacteroidetes bacterium MED-G17]|nr:MAG: Hydroxyacylglutathione hydrolase GloC [Bacteroidetes bacterium MED-G17]|tara:strand:+ start:14850 stop:16238 length:1389 start_codon:yes stop_codon:yes gene_type:complete